MLRLVLLVSLFAVGLTGCDKTPGPPDGPPDGTVTIPIHFQEDFERDYLRVDFEGERVFEGSVTTLSRTGLATVVPVFADEDGGDQRVVVTVDRPGTESDITGAVDFDPREAAAIVVCLYREEATFRLRPVDAVPSYDASLPAGTTRCPALGP